MRASGILVDTRISRNTSSVVVLVQRQTSWAGAGYRAVFVQASVRASAVIDETLIDFHASFSIVLEKPVSVRTGALDSAISVRAEMRASSVVLDAFVDVLAGSIVFADFVSWWTLAAIASQSVDADVRTGFVDVIRIAAFIHVLTGFVVFHAENESWWTNIG